MLQFNHIIRIFILSDLLYLQCICPTEQENTGILNNSYINMGDGVGMRTFLMGMGWGYGQSSRERGGSGGQSFEDGWDGVKNFLPMQLSSINYDFKERAVQ